MNPFREIPMAALSVKKALPVMTAARPLPQAVPSSACFRCDICCRFPDPDSVLRPYFTGKEIAYAVEHGLEARAFPDHHGSQVALVPNPNGEGFLCPAFEAESGRCRLYEQRPLDCQLYPLVLMWTAGHDEVVLGWDTTCPFTKEHIPESIRRHAESILRLLEEQATVERIADHPRLIGRFQEEAMVLAPLGKLTRAIRVRWGGETCRRLVLEDLSRLRAALDRSPLSGSLAAYSVPYHYMWNALLPYWWVDLDGAMCLFIQSPDGWFMPLPPLTGEPLERTLSEAFRLMRRWNGNSAVSRVENVPAALASALAAKGYRVTPKGPDYVYQADELARLAGDRYKSQRALCNRVEREGGIVVEPFHERDRAACRELLRNWRRQKISRRPDPWAELLLEDSLSAHEVTWSHASDLGVAGFVLRRNGTLCGYTFGYWLDRRTWCVLLEVTDRAIAGLAQYLFRETCRRARTEGAEFINTMDDSGLDGLRLSKEAYHPVMRIESFVCSEAMQP
jgi:Fe-S-cluster containining protein